MPTLAVDRPTSERALADLYAEHGRSVLGFVVSSIGDRAVAEEVTQEVFLRAWLHADRYDAGRGSARTWLFSIARNLVIDTARARAVRPQAADVDPADTPSATDELDRLELRLLLVEALRRLSPEHREVVTHVAIRGGDLRTAADQLGVPVGTIKSRLFYGLAQLRLAFAELGVER
jgi:RNA polymerase sigma-70 factor (ECF subfamily)